MSHRLEKIAGHIDRLEKVGSSEALGTLRKAFNTLSEIDSALDRIEAEDRRRGAIDEFVKSHPAINGAYLHGNIGEDVSTALEKLT